MVARCDGTWGFWRWCGGHHVAIDAGVTRVEVVTPGTCAMCGGTVTVRTDAGTPFTAAECETICASVWCGVGGVPYPRRCDLSGETVRCSAVVFDCGSCFTGYCGACGDGCCDPASRCCQPQQPLHCRGLNCSACPAADARCDLAHCRDFKSYGGALKAEPRAAACANADGGVDVSVELASWCVDACNAEQAGAIVEGTCDGGVDTDAGVPAADAGACLAACATTRDACEQNCPLNSYSACLDCSLRCGIDEAHCEQRCQ